MQAASAPQVRTILLTDLVESTHLVERLGDAPAAALFRAHDRLVLELQQRWRGRLIDRSDGLLLLFERPIDGLGFALDYARGLRDLGREMQLKLALQARAGLHVGEVLIWENSADSVRLGAKPVEVEGLAKPLAGRLMALARPGQILLSATAEPLAHRAARELGQRGQLLVWKSYGRWRFKGVPEAQEVYEVGEPGLAPLRMPAHTPKAWRDLPLWRRPLALAAEAMLVAGMALGAWFLAQPRPAIAFAERDWVVVGDLRNLTGDARLDESLEQAFRISLEQSRYVNVLSDLKTRDTLQRMQRKPDTAVDRTLGSEIALRDGARALLLPTVAEVGGRLRVSAEVIDPRTQTTVYAVSADGKGIDSALGSIDDVTDQLREKLGEALESVQRTSVALPNVATPSLEALKAYAMGRMYKIQRSDLHGAAELFQHALELDPKFAMARAQLGFVQYRMGKTTEALANIRQALVEPERMTPRERLRWEGLLAQFGPVDALLAQRRRQITLYPDDLRAQFDLAQEGWQFANLYAESLPHARAAAVPMSEMRTAAHHIEGILLLGMNKPEDALQAFRLEGKAGGELSHRGMVLVHEIQRRYPQADAELQAAFRGDEVASHAAAELRLLLLVDRGQLEAGQRVLEQALARSDRNPVLQEVVAEHLQVIALQVLTGTRIDRAGWDAASAALLRQEDVLRQRYVLYPVDAALQLGYLAARAGDADVAARLLGRASSPALLALSPMTRQMHAALQAEIDLASGKSGRAIARLQPLAQRQDAILVVQASLLHALRAAGRTSEALRQARKLQTLRSRAFVEKSGFGGLDPWEVAAPTIAILDEAELLQSMGQSAAAQRRLQLFLKHWDRARLPEPLARRVAALMSPEPPQDSSGKVDLRPR